MNAKITVYHDTHEVKTEIPKEIAQNPLFRLGLTMGRGYDIEWEDEDNGVFWGDKTTYYDFISLSTVPQIKEILEELGIKAEIKEVR